jgi:hypothetical protein
MDSNPTTLLSFSDMANFMDALDGAEVDAGATGQVLQSMADAERFKRQNPRSFAFLVACARAEVPFIAVTRTSEQWDDLKGNKDYKPMRKLIESAEQLVKCAGLGSMQTKWMDLAKGLLVLDDRLHKGELHTRNAVRLHSSGEKPAIFCTVLIRACAP